MAVNPSIHQLSQEIANLLSETLKPDEKVRKAAENELFRLESFNQLYGMAALYLTRRDDLASTDVHLSAAIAFKNYVKRYWRYDENKDNSDHQNKITDEQRNLIKQNITIFMIESKQQSIQLQLSEVISYIGESDFPEKWPHLIYELRDKVNQFNNNNGIISDSDFSSLKGILHTAHSIFVCYRHKLQSNQLWSEIKLVIENFAPALTDNFKYLVSCIRTNTSNLDDSKLLHIYQSLLLCTRIYHDLVTQDLPEYFEDRINEWLPLFLELLATEKKFPPHLNHQNVVEDLKAELCEIASLFVQRYSDIENFKEYVQKFAQHIWNLLVTTDQDIQYDTLVCTAIRYLVAVAERPESRVLFEDANVLNLLCQRVIIPNLTFREIDEELFDDDPDGYVSKEVSGSDIYSRRQTACNLVQTLGKFLEVQLIETFGRYIEEMLKSYETNRIANWRHKDLAIFLYSSLSIKGSTREHGTVSISQHVDVRKFLEEKIIDELLNESNHLSSHILKVDALRYITIFRNHIPLDTLHARLPLIIEHIKSENVVVRTFASITLEKLLTMRDPKQPKTTAFKPEHFEPILKDLVKTLFEALNTKGSLENEHIMKAIMRLFGFTKSNLLVQFLPIVVPNLTTKLGIVAKNPSKPYFNHYLFETLALTIRSACLQSDNPSMRMEFEKVLFNILEVVVAQDVQEFTPYVLQLLHLLLKAQKVGSMSDGFVKLFAELLAPAFWDRPGNVTPLTELMITYVEKLNHCIISQDKLIPLLGVFQKLIASKATDHEGLALLQAIMIHLPQADVDARICDIFMLIFHRLTGSKTVKFVKNVLVCFSLYAYFRGAEALASAVNRLQDKMFGMVLEKLYIADVKKVTGHLERRICQCGIVKILSTLPLIENGCYIHLWAPLLLVLMESFESTEQITQDEDDYFVDITEILDFQGQYSRLSYASCKRQDPTQEVKDLKLFLAASLANLSTKLPGFVSKTVQDNLDQRAVACLMNYCQTANVTIS